MRATSPLKLIPLLLLLSTTGCPHRTPPEPTADTAYLRRNLFSAFNADAEELSLGDAYLLELACFVGDKGTFELDRTLEAWGFTRRRDFRALRTSTYGYVASNDRMVLVTFGGTDILNLRDVLSDVDALQLVHDPRYCATPEARVHRGFRDSLSSVIDGVIEEVRRQAQAQVPPTTLAPPTAPDSRGATPPRKRLFIAGHSRGGAFAVLAAAAMRKESDLPEIAGVYTFGQPRVGNAAFAQQLDGGAASGASGSAGGAVPLFRFVNRDDPVPNVPPETPGASRLGAALDYRHAGTVVLLREDGRVVHASDAEMTRRLPDPRVAGASVANHYQPAYQAAIYAALAKPELIEDPAWRAVPAPAIVAVLPKPAK